MGTGFVPGAAVTISGTGVTVNSTTYVDPSHLTATSRLSTSASLTNRDVTVTNPGTATGTCTGCLGINQGPYGIAAVPFSMGRGAVSENVTFVGFNFVSGDVDACLDPVLRDGNHGQLRDPGQLRAAHGQPLHQPDRHARRRQRHRRQP